MFKENKVRMPKILNAILMTGLLAVGAGGFGISPAGARPADQEMLFFDSADSTGTDLAAGMESETISVKMALELERDGQVREVPFDTLFRAGDQVRIFYSISRECQVYWLSEGTSEDFYMLFPNPRFGTENTIKPNEIHVLPGKPGASFKFKEPTRVEKLILVLATQKIPELELASREAAVKDGKIKENSYAVLSVRDRQAGKLKTRDLVYEERQDPSGVWTKTQLSKAENEPFVICLELTHN